MKIYAVIFVVTACVLVFTVEARFKRKKYESDFIFAEVSRTRVLSHFSNSHVRCEDELEMSNLRNGCSYNHLEGPGTRHGQKTT